MLPFDLHVLGLPPAFTLSQDQTLHLKLQNPKVQYLECRARSRHQITRLHLHAFELTCCSVTNVCLWTTIHSPDARTSHLRTLSKITGPASAPFPFLASPRRTEVPEGADYYTANFDSVNTVSRSFSLPPPAVQCLFQGRPG